LQDDGRHRSDLCYDRVKGARALDSRERKARTGRSWNGWDRWTTVSAGRCETAGRRDLFGHTDAIDV